MIKIILSAFTGLLLLASPTVASTTKIAPTSYMELPDDSTILVRGQLITAIQNLDEGIGLKQARNKLRGVDLLLCVHLECELFKIYGNLVRKGESSTNMDNRLLSFKLKEKLIAYQVKELPKMRVAYAKAIHDILKADIYIRTSSKTKTFNFTAEMIKSEDDMLKLNTAFAEDLCLLRFNKAVYKQKRQDIESDCYTMDSPADSVLF